MREGLGVTVEIYDMKIEGRVRIFKPNTTKQRSIIAVARKE